MKAPLHPPADHLDIETIDAVIVALGNFQGGVIVVSHDGHFVESVCDEVCWRTSSSVLRTNRYECCAPIDANVAHQQIRSERTSAGSLPLAQPLNILLLPLPIPPLVFVFPDMDAGRRQGEEAAGRVEGLPQDRAGGDRGEEGLAAKRMQPLLALIITLYVARPRDRPTIAMVNSNPHCACTSSRGPPEYYFEFFCDGPRFSHLSNS